MVKYCQVCGSPIVSADSHGTEANGQLSRDFCSNCYQNGQFSNDVKQAGNYAMLDNPAMYMAPLYPGYGYTGLNMH